MLIPVEIASFGVDTQANAPLIILKECAGNRSFAIPLDQADARTIAIHSLEVKTEQPYAVDLLMQIASSSSCTFIKATIHTREGAGFTGRIYYTIAAMVHISQCRIGDLIALALRGKIPILAEESLFTVSAETASLANRIAALNTIDFGTYHLE